MLAMTLTVGLAVLVLFVAWVSKLLISKIQYNYKYKFPNVVPGRPLIGSTLDVPYPAGMYTRELAKKYGEL